MLSCSEVELADELEESEETVLDEWSLDADAEREVISLVDALLAELLLLLSNDELLVET